MYIFNRGLVSVLGIFAVVLSSSAHGQDGPSLEATAASSSVEINTSNGRGMGVVLEDGATIATCAHVVENHTWVKVTMGSFVDDGYVIAVNREDDIAIVRTKYKMQPFRLDTCMHTLIKGDFAVAAGRKPVSGRPDMRFGAVVGYIGGYSSDMHISANIERGFSGGPVMDRDGYLIGISQGLVGSYTAGIGSRTIPTWKIVSLIRNTRLKLSENYSRPSVAPMELTALVPALPELDTWMAKFNSN